MPTHQGIDNKNVGNNVGRLIDGWSGSPVSLCTDGDLLACISRMLRYRSSDSVKVGEVKGHATDTMVADGRVRREDKEGTDAADVAADFGRLRQPGWLLTPGELCSRLKRNGIRVWSCTGTWLPSRGEA